MKAYPLLAFLLVGASCTKPETAEIKRDLAAIPNALRLPLGAGYQSVSGTYLNQGCLGPSADKNAIQPLSFPEGSLSAGFGESRSVVSDKFSMSVNVEGGMPTTISVDGGVDIAIAFVETDLKTSSYVSYSYRAGSVILMDPVISPIGQGILQKAKVSGNPSLELMKGCGDEWVQRVDLGARFHVGVEYTFASKEMKDEAKLRLNIRGPLGVKIFSFEEGHSGTLLNQSLGTVRLVMFQEGGDMQAFAKLKEGMPQDCVLKLDNQGKVVQDGFQSCTQYYQKSIVPYIRDLNREGSFAQQMKALGGDGFKYVDGDPMVQPGLNVLRYYTRRYDQSAFPEMQTTWQAPREVQSFAHSVLVPFDEAVFRLQGWKRSLDEVAGHPEIIKPQGVDQGKLVEAKRDIGAALDEGLLGLQRCRSRLQSRLVEAPDAGAIEADKVSCNADRNAFIAKYNAMVSQLPESYKQLIKPL